jgi:hypothetical protein
MMKRLQLLLLMLLALPIGMLADSQNTLVVKLKNGAETTFFLKDKPNVTFEGTDLKVVSNKETVTFALSDVLRFTYVKKDASGIDETVVDPTEVSYDGGVLVISQLKQGASVDIYSLDGKLLRQLTAHHSGTYRLNLSELPKGVYLVKADNVTYKIMKP